MISDYRQECEDLAAAFQWTAKINMHEAEAHFRDIKKILNREGSDYKN